MDAPNPSALPTFASRTPLHIGAISLKVRDLETLVAFYRDALGLSVVGTGEHGAALGAGARDPDRAGLALLTLEAADGAAFLALKQRLTSAGIPFSEASAGIETVDPWGTRLRVVPA